MKKILVVLLILAVAGGVFAQQGDWSLGAKAEVGTRINLDPDSDYNNDVPAQVGGTTYNSWQNQRGVFDLSYNRDILTSGIVLNADSWGSTDFYTSFHGDNYSAKFSFKNLTGIIFGGNIFSWDDHVNQLWGEYGFLNGLLNIRAAYDSGWLGGEWMSNGAGSWADLGNNRDGLGFGQGVSPFTGTPGGFSQNHLRAKIDLNALSFGLQIPDLFTSYTHNLAKGPTSSLQGIVMGVSFGQEIFDFAAQFKFANYGVYFGGNVNLGLVKAGLSFTGVLDGDGGPDSTSDNNVDWKRYRIGGNVDYNAEMFGGGLLAFYEREDEHVTNGGYTSKIGIEPNFFYNAIPSYLQFKLDVGFYFFNAKDTATPTGSAITWGLQPQVFWNFLGTGAGDWGVSHTGIAVRYRLSSADLGKLGLGNNGVNTLDFLFRWGF